MKVGLIGFSGAGKTTLFKACSGGQVRGDVVAVPVPDPRFDRIVSLVQPKKATPASVVLHDDLEDVAGTGRMFSQSLIDAARRMDALLEVVRAFDSPAAPYHDAVDPARDLRRLEEELVLLDLGIVETRLERLAKSAPSRQPGSPEYREREFLERIRPVLESGRPLRDEEFSEEDQALARNYQFLSVKPLVTCVNVDEAEEEALRTGRTDLVDELAARGRVAFAVCAKLEEEIAGLEAEDRASMLEALGLERPASARLVRAVYDALGLITFYTAGENETRAWPLRRGASALKAAATIHTDIAKGFIRAEVVHYEDFVEHGSLEAAARANKRHLEGKDYVVQDGDLLNIRHKS